MAQRDLLTIWPQLKASAQEMFSRAATEVLKGHNGVIELHCREGGIRLVRIGKEMRPGDKEYRLGNDEEDK
jgi:hypothetical protein